MLAAGTTALATSLSAGDVALFINTDRYDAQPRVRDAERFDSAADQLGENGFEVLMAEGRDRADLDTLLEDFAAATTDADRIVVVLSGHVVTDGRRAWLLADDAPRDVSLFGLNAAAVSIDSLLVAMAGAPGQSVLMVATRESEPSVGWGLSTGLGDLALPQGVTLVTGGPNRLRALAEDQLAEPGADLGAALGREGAPQARGFLPDQLVLVPAPPVVDGAEDGLSELDLWEATEALDQIAAYEAYLRAFPNGRFAEDAQAAIDAIRAEPVRDARLEEEALGLNSTARRAIQADLTLLNYNTRGVDGVFGPGTRSAIANWQQQNGYAQTSYLTAAQIADLERQATLREAEIAEAEERERQEAIEADRAFWRATGARGSESGYLAYLDNYPDGIFASAARAGLEAIDEARKAAASADERAAWEDAEDAGTREAYEDYLDAYPNGAFADDAALRLSELDEAEASEPFDRAAAEAAEEALGLNRVTRQLIELRLAQIGLDPGVTDGRFDAESREAIRQYQEARNIPATGYLNDATVVRLLAGGIGIRN